MKILVDTNVIIDVFTERPGHEYSNTFLRLTNERTMTLMLTVGQTTDIFYILSRYPQTKDNALEIVKSIGKHMVLTDSLVVDFYNAVQLNFSDFEDAILACTAKRLRIDYIVTNNKKDFTNSPVPPLSPKEFLDRFK